VHIETERTKALLTQLRDNGDTAVAERPAGKRPLDDLLAAVTDGEWAAWDEIVRRYERLVFHTALKTGLSHSDAADVAQLTWLRLWEHGHQIREPGALASWLVCTARREAIRVSSASRRYIPCADPSTEYGRLGAGTAADRYPAEQEYDGVIEQALERLPDRYRTLLRLLSSDFGLTYAEVAERMGLPIGSIGPMRMRAIRLLEKTPEFTSGSFPRPALAAAA
jgi:RNA polymerase sigma factor (sigma-70 family)